ncbi:MAG TPA: hypothetical protein VE093_02175 [Polyangiaceae bacterium]|nr:hypothetical protein [Polyangiaceae bacterium]
MGLSSIPPGPISYTPSSYVPPSSTQHRELPVPAGTSPFHVKGLAYRGFEAYAKRNVAGGMDRVRAEVDDPALRAFLMQPFMAGSWYDVLPVVPLASAIAALERSSMEDFVRRTSRRQALYDAQHVHKRFFQGYPPSSLVSRLPRFFMQYTDFGRAEVAEAAEVTGPETGQGTVIRTGVPAFILPWFLPMNEAYIEAILDGMGSARPRAKGQVLPKDGEVAGVPTVTVRFRMMW